jgi:hypothetical protein
MFANNKIKNITKSVKTLKYLKSKLVVRVRDLNEMIKTEEAKIEELKELEFEKADDDNGDWDETVCKKRKRFAKKIGKGFVSGHCMKKDAHFRDRGSAKASRAGKKTQRLHPEKHFFQESEQNAHWEEEGQWYLPGEWDPWSPTPENWMEEYCRRILVSTSKW